MIAVAPLQDRPNGAGPTSSASGETIAARCLKLLAEGPATTSEVALALRLSSRHAGAHLALLYNQRKVAKRAFEMNAGRKAWLWSLIEHAEPGALRAPEGRAA